MNYFLIQFAPVDLKLCAGIRITVEAKIDARSPNTAVKKEELNNQCTTFNATLTVVKYLSKVVIWLEMGYV